jgi:spore coat polysaccharide biosynthesis protein SpsF
VAADRRIAAIVQARSSSERLPGKVLLEVEGKPVLQYVLERLAHAELLATAIVATSEDAADDGIARLCARLGVECDRGPLDDVAGRLLGSAEKRGLDAFVRVNGDSPLLDQRLVDQAVRLLRAGDCDLVTNVFPRTFPRGESVEAITTEALRRAYARMEESEDLEHVTRFLYRHSSEFRIRNFASDADLTSMRLAIDTEAELDLFASIVARMTRPHWEYPLEEILRLAAAESRSEPA